jgi:pimeloyl-ACP methyl ester carboxylesterase
MNEGKYLTGLCSVLMLLFSAGAGAVELVAPGRLVEIDSHRLHIQCSGPGVSGPEGPTVILEAGLGGIALEWAMVQAGLARDHRVCSYDRAGMGWSEIGPLPRTSERLVDELHELLSEAEVPGPYVLVGHSFGGYTVQLFASRYPALTAGLVLVDASHPDQIDRYAAPPVKTTIAPRGRLMILMAVGVPEQLSASQRWLAQRLATAHKARLAVTRELEGFRASAAQLQAAGPLPPVPLVVISRGLQKWPDDERGTLKENLWQELQADLARRGTPGVQLIARRSGHHVHLDQPELVIHAVRAVVAAVVSDHAPRSGRLRTELTRLPVHLGADAVAVQWPEPARPTLVAWQ